MSERFEVYRSLTRRSRELYEHACRWIPGGVTSNIKFISPYPIFLARGHGSKVYDVDGREYIDYHLAFGVAVAGHGHPRIFEAIRNELEGSGTLILGGPSELEARLAERLCAVLPSAEMVRFTNSGTESTMHALRIARGATGRSRIVKFEGHYHGVHDSVLLNTDRPLPASPVGDGIPTAVQQATLVLPFNDIETMRQTLNAAEDVAAVIVEPIARGAIAAELEFLKALREVTTNRGIILVFDEVISWPRVGLGGAQGVFGVTPDLTALGKAVGGGLPMGAVVGKRALMRLVTPPGARLEHAAQEPEGMPLASDPYVFHSGTYNGTRTALAAGLASLDLLQEGDTLARLMAAGAKMRENVRDLLVKAGREAQVIGIGGVFDFYFTAEPIRSSREIWRSDLELRRAIDYRLLEEGIYNAPVHRFHLSVAHSSSDMERTLQVLGQVLDALPAKRSPTVRAHPVATP